MLKYPPEAFLLSSISGESHMGAKHETMELGGLVSFCNPEASTINPHILFSRTNYQFHVLVGSGSSIPTHLLRPPAPPAHPVQHGAAFVAQK